MGQALYRKYRSKNLDEIVGQEHITKTLTQAVKSGRISHAYLFTGPRGVGKTSIARILAHDINKLPYSDESSHVDIIEIDAASNGRIDEIRDLREKVYISPTSAKYKVYIIDEAHMMTPDAFNALLKTLEEPPAHVVFILATTNVQKLPETIISRTQRFQFKPIELAKVAGHLKYIAKQEGIKISDDALLVIAEHGQGSFRDSISLLDQAANFADPVTLDTINNLLGIPPSDLINQLAGSLEGTSPSEVIKALNNLYIQGYPATVIATRLSKILREQLVEGNSKLSSDQLLETLSRLIEVPTSPHPEQFLEICLLKALPVTMPKKTEVVIESERVIAPKKEEAPQAKQVKAKAPETIAQKPKSSASTSKLNQAQWTEVLTLLRAKYNTLYGIARMGKADFATAGVVKLLFAFPFHQKRINDPKNRQLILDAINQVSGSEFSLECIVDPTLLNQSRPKPSSNDLETISTIFGGGEILS